MAERGNNKVTSLNSTEGRGNRFNASRTMTSSIKMPAKLRFKNTFLTSQRHNADDYRFWAVPMNKIWIVNREFERGSFVLAMRQKNSGINDLGFKGEQGLGARVGQKV